MEDFNLNALWCRALIEELLHSGLRHAILCPGGRSAIMAMLLHNHFQLDTIIHGDERSAAFIALGITKIIHKPVIICTTSGSAVANLIPALTEAYAAQLPLILLTGDRPASMRFSGAPQSTKQIEICKPLVNASFDLCDPIDDENTLLALRSKIAELSKQLAENKTHGPVHINVPLHANLCTTEINPKWIIPTYSELTLHGRFDAITYASIPFLKHTKSSLKKTKSLTDLKLNQKLRPGMKGLIIVGNNCSLSYVQMKLLAKKTQFPVIADVVSQFRRPAIENIIFNADVLMMNQLTQHNPELIIHIGDAPIAHSIQSYLQKQECLVLRIDTKNNTKDFLYRSFERLEQPTDLELDELASKLEKGNIEWLTDWKLASKHAEKKTDQYIKQLAWSDVKVANIICNNTQFDWLHLANSMAIRYGNILCKPTDHPQPIYGNRGVNGIDGTLGTFFGELYASKKSGLLLVGDQTFLHDLPALVNIRQYQLDGCICILNNNGNALFDLLAVARLPQYKKIIRNPTDTQFSHIAASFGLSYRSCYNENDLDRALMWSGNEDGIHIIEAIVPEDMTAKSFIELYKTIGKTEKQPIEM